MLRRPMDTSPPDYEHVAINMGWFLLPGDLRGGPYKAVTMVKLATSYGTLQIIRLNTSGEPSTAPR